MNIPPMLSNVGIFPIIDFYMIETDKLDSSIIPLSHSGSFNKITPVSKSFFCSLLHRKKLVKLHLCIMPYMYHVFILFMGVLEYDG